MLKGADFSKWQGTIDWDAVKASLDFAIVKATEGSPDPGQSVAAYEDPAFKRNQAEARRVGILRGWYHFGRPDFNDPEPEAEELWSAIGGLQKGEVVCLDMEQSTTKDVVDWSKRFLDRFQQLSGGLKGLIYMSESWVLAHDWTSVYGAGYGLWVAKYGANDGSVPSSVNTGIWPTAAIWQYASVGSAAGISPLDMDNFYGDAASWMKYGYNEPFTTTTTTTESPATTTTTTEVVIPITVSTTSAPVDAIQPSTTTSTTTIMDTTTTTTTAVPVAASPSLTLTTSQWEKVAKAAGYSFISGFFGTLLLGATPLIDSVSTGTFSQHTFVALIVAAFVAGLNTLLVFLKQLFSVN
jgi:GH25 family lysozyme M1 (1,4-beta-N-acetylmuramidase)